MTYYGTKQEEIDLAYRLNKGKLARSEDLMFAEMCKTDCDPYHSDDGEGECSVCEGARAREFKRWVLIGDQLDAELARIKTYYK
jgi:hypothetical protein